VYQESHCCQSFLRGLLLGKVLDSHGPAAAELILPHLQQFESPVGSLAHLAHKLLFDFPVFGAISSTEDLLDVFGKADEIDHAFAVQGGYFADDLVLANQERNEIFGINKVKFPGRNGLLPGHAAELVAYIQPWLLMVRLYSRQFLIWL